MTKDDLPERIREVLKRTEQEPYYFISIGDDRFSEGSLHHLLGRYAEAMCRKKPETEAKQ